jgi:hypothetical protein
MSIMAGRPPMSVDASFFDYWTPPMAWALGLFFTDGHLRPRVGYTAPRLCFTQKSPELLYKLKALMRCNAIVHYRPRRQYNGKTAGATFQFSLANAKLGARLMELGITPRKSLTMQFPDAPADCVRHFIRGCWDGDGSVLRHADGRHLTAKFGCGSRPFVEGMLRELYLGGLPERRIYRLRRGGRDLEYYYFVFQRPRDVQLLFSLPLRRGACGVVIWRENTMRSPSISAKPIASKRLG